MTMYATVDPITNEVDHDTVSEDNGENRWPFVHEGPPPCDPRREKAVSGKLYFDRDTQTVRRTWHVVELTPKELAERKGLHSLKVLALSDQGMVRALEDIVLFLLEERGLSLDDPRIPKEAADKFRERIDVRKQLLP